MIYFDNAATTYPKPKEVYDFMDNFIKIMEEVMLGGLII